MELRLILFRHAQAEDEGPRTSDHQRCLTVLGKQQASATARQLAEAGYLPSLVLVSDAARTLGTWEHAQGWLGDRAEVRALHEIYTDDVRGLSKLLGAQDLATHRTIALIGHNPHISGLAAELTGLAAFRFAKGQALVMELKSDSWAEAICDTGEWRVAADFGGKI